MYHLKCNSKLHSRICDGRIVVTSVCVTLMMLSQDSWHPGPTFVMCPAELSLDMKYKGWFLISMIIILFNSGNFFSIIRGTSFRTNLSGRHLSSVHQCLPGSGLGIFVGAIINGCNNSLRAGGVGRLHQTLSFLQTIDIIFDDFQWYRAVCPTAHMQTLHLLFLFLKSKEVHHTSQQKLDGLD